MEYLSLTLASIILGIVIIGLLTGAAMIVIAGLLILLDQLK